MFEHLKGIDEKLYNRYLTVERNVKAASNSFYDAYLDMLEEFIKIVVERNSFGFNGTCGQILMRQDFKDYFIKELCVDEFTFNKMRDYTRKVNQHKHSGEKKIMPDTIVTYLKIFHSATEAYARKYGTKVSDYDANHVLEIYGQFEKLNEKLKTAVENLKNELSRSVYENKLKDEDIRSYRALLSQAEIDKLSMEEQTLELYRQISILKDIKLSSMEEKLNKTIDLLNELTQSVVENRIIVRAVGKTVGGLINGDRDVDAWIEKEKKESKK